MHDCKTRPRLIASRISGDTQRPSLSGTKYFVEEIEEILEIRRPHYQAAAAVIFPINNETPESIAKRISGNLQFLT